MAKTKTDFKNIDEYISTFPKETQEVMEKIRKLINKIIPEVTETISYQIPTFNLNGKYFIYFAGYKNHISLYPVHPEEMPFENELTKYASGQSTLKFPLKDPIPYNLIIKIIEFKLDQSKN